MPRFRRARFDDPRANALRAAFPGARVVLDQARWPVVRGQRGRVEYLDERQVIAFTRDTRAATLLSHCPAAKWWAGDVDERRYTIPAEPFVLAHVGRVLALH